MLYLCVIATTAGHIPMSYRDYHILWVIVTLCPTLNLHFASEFYF